MCLLCQLPVVKNHNFGQILTLGVPYRPPFSDEGQIWCSRADPRSTLMRQISSECVHCRPPVAKNHDLGQMLTFGELLYRPSFTNEGQIWCDIPDLWYTLTCQISCRSVYSVALCWRKPQFLSYFGLRHLVLSLVGNSLTKLNTGAQPQTFRYPTVQTNRQTKTHRFWPSRRRVKSEPHQTWQSNRGPRACSCTSKTFGGLTHSFAARGR